MGYRSKGSTFAVGKKAHVANHMGRWQVWQGRRTARCTWFSTSGQAQSAARRGSGSTDPCVDIRHTIWSLVALHFHAAGAESISSGFGRLVRGLLLSPVATVQKHTTIKVKTTKTWPRQEHWDTGWGNLGRTSKRDWFESWLGGRRHEFWSMPFSWTKVHGSGQWGGVEAVGRMVRGVHSGFIAK